MLRLRTMGTTKHSRSSAEFVWLLLLLLLPLPLL